MLLAALVGVEAIVWSLPPITGFSDTRGLTGLSCLLFPTLFSFGQRSTFSAPTWGRQNCPQLPRSQELHHRDQRVIILRLGQWWLPTVITLSPIIHFFGFLLLLVRSLPCFAALVLRLHISDDSQTWKKLRGAGGEREKGPILTTTTTPLLIGLY